MAANTTGIRIPRQKFVSRYRDTTKSTNILRGVFCRSCPNRDVSLKIKAIQRWLAKLWPGPVRRKESHFEVAVF
jgi:hypothetical protein